MRGDLEVRKAFGKLLPKEFGFDARRFDASKCTVVLAVVSDRPGDLVIPFSIAGSGNVFLDLGFDVAEARVMALRMRLMVRLREHLQEKGYTQVETANRLGMTQPRVSALFKGSWRDFSMDMLLTFAIRAGPKPELHLAAAEKRSAA